MVQKISEIVEKYNEAKAGYKTPPKDTRLEILWSQEKAYS